MLAFSSSRSECLDLSFKISYGYIMIELALLVLLWTMLCLYTPSEVLFLLSARFEVESLLMIGYLLESRYLFSLSCSLTFGFITDNWALFTELVLLTIDGCWWVDIMEEAVIWVWVALIVCFVVFLPVPLLSEVPWLLPILWVWGAFAFFTLVKPAVMFWPLLLTFEFITLFVSLAWWFAYLFITIED